MSQAEANAGEDVQHENNDADRLSQDADRAETLVRSLIVGEHVDIELAQQLQNDLVEMFGQMIDQHDDLTAAEIALALWGEVLRIEDLVTEAEEEAEEAETSTEASMEEALDNEDLELLGGGQEADADGQEAAAPENDPAFH